MFKWVNKINACNEAAKLHKSQNISIEKACDSILVNDANGKYAMKIESMTKKQFEDFVTETKDYI